MSTGIVSLKFEKLSELSWEAEGLLTRMVNNPKCDYVTAEILHEMFPADSLETFQQALDELVEKILFYNKIKKYILSIKSKWSRKCFI